MKLYLVRHGESSANIGDLFSLPTISLTENGFRDAERAGRLLKNLPYDRVLVSPFLRARQTLATALPGVEGEIVDLLRECDCGSLEGEHRVAMLERYPDLARHVAEDDYTPYGGENYEHLRGRVRELMEYVVSLNAERVVAFTHAGIILTMFDEIMSRPGKVGRRMQCRNGGVNIFEYKDGRWSVAAMNITEDVLS